MRHLCMFDIITITNLKISSLNQPLGSYFFEADFQVVLRLLLIIWKSFIDQKLLFYMDLEEAREHVYVHATLPSEKQANASEQEPTSR